MAEVIPSILVKSSQEFTDKLRLVESFVGRVHVDIADGIFVPNKTIDGVDEVESADSQVLFGVHLMVSKPENHLARWLEAPIESISFHIEATNKEQQVIDEIKEADILVGIALNPATPVSSIEDYVNQLDFVHFMTVEPGFYGGEFIPDVIKKIADFHYFYPDMPITVDGGITPENATELVQAGATTLIVGSYIFQAKEIKKALDEFRN